MKAISMILQAVLNSRESLVNLKALSLQNVEFNLEIAEIIGKILSENNLEDLCLSGCQIGKSEEIVTIISESIGSNSSLRGLELNDNKLTDTMGVKILSKILRQASLAEAENPMLLVKLCFKNNYLKD
jgi:hypothetical protein